MTDVLNASRQVLILLLLAMPEALSREAAVDVPLAASLFSLPFYLLCLLGSALHVLICTSAGGLCYLCSLPWVLVFTVIVLSSGLMCALVAMAARRMPTSSKTPTKVRGSWGVMLHLTSEMFFSLNRQRCSFESGLD